MLTWANKTTTAMPGSRNDYSNDCKYNPIGFY